MIKNIAQKRPCSCERAHLIDLTAGLKVEVGQCAGPPGGSPHRAQPTLLYAQRALEHKAHELDEVPLPRGKMPGKRSENDGLSVERT